MAQGVGQVQTPVPKNETETIAMHFNILHTTMIAKVSSSLKFLKL
jgi:hypothetical protein